ncbi:MAG: selenide, water dikinase SelD [Phycisphaeraceae bacterium]|nr:selenide, water dikinase SelD [Phycisphaerales bacterium]QOJ18115.1 MAG: selenide, water dikinase SelD [Phycisphaeraceae bacterium]
MQHLPLSSDPNLLVGPEHFSDAGVYRLADGLAIVQTVDFFPPIVDDPYTYGRIAAANSLSDVYAMGGRPVTAMNIVGFPDQELPMEILSDILRGGAERVHAAGAVTVGGHSVRDNEIKYGLSVTGVVDPARMLTNAKARPGDVVVLTKALGTGFVTTANKADRCPAVTLEAAVASMVTLNDAASRLAVELGAHAATDITGYGLSGHACEVANASGVTIEIDLASLPLLTGSEELAAPLNFTRANKATRGFLEGRIRWVGTPDDLRTAYLFDPQTSGGLLVSIDPARGEEYVRRCRAAGATATTIVGRVLEQAGVDLIAR